MFNNNIQYWLNFSFLSSDNRYYLEQLYKKYLNDSNSVDIRWKNIFDNISSITSLKSEKSDIFYSKLENNKITSFATNSNLLLNSKEIKIFQFLTAFRSYGHLEAKLDPLELWKRSNIDQLNPKFYGLSKYDFNKQIYFDLFTIDNKKNMTFSELYNVLKRIYSSSIGIEYMHLTNLREKQWIQEQIENNVDINKFFNKEEKINFLIEILAAENLEHNLNTKFPGAKRFSLEGGDVLITMLRDLIRNVGKYNIDEIVCGMAHRGRLNVLINVLGKMPNHVYDEFYGANINVLNSGDVKYHQGYSSNYKTKDGLIHLSLLFNPSHLEIINAVLTGSVRARIDLKSNIFNNNISSGVLPITIHGDASVTGQGVIQEILNMSAVRGYKVNGTIRIIINNQIGFTTSNIYDARSTKYCTDIMKMIEAPIFHVNADDVESVMFVTRLALNFRNLFKRDVVIDLVCYRRHGHNEADEPSVTQPIMYNVIKHHPSISKIYSNKLINDNIINQSELFQLINKYNEKLDSGICMVDEHIPYNRKNSIWEPFLYHNSTQKVIIKKVSQSHLEYLSNIIFSIPKHILMHSRVKKIYEDRLKMIFKTKLLDWGTTEILTYATLLDDGISIRLSGEDVGRGTFFHRHAVIHNQLDGTTYIPLNNINDKQGQFNIWDSVLSEESVLGFEYGYAITNPKMLVIWEAQFGDFANGAQIVIDQFISSGEQKWGRMCGLVMLLPHGYEGQGPEHSSARLERFLQLCSENNMFVCVPSLPAQLYHILRLQILSNIRKPLIVMSPKSLLRHPLAISHLNDLSDGMFYPVINEIDKIDIKKVHSIIFCAGKIFYDLLEERRNNKQTDIAIIRIEQLYPFPSKEICSVLKNYALVRTFIWCQEEPMNQGAWYFVEHNMKNIIPINSIFTYVGRTSSASPAVGYASVHNEQQKKIIKYALKIN